MTVRRKAYPWVCVGGGDAAGEGVPDLQWPHCCPTDAAAVRDGRWATRARRQGQHPLMQDSLANLPGP